MSNKTSLSRFNERNLVEILEKMHLIRLFEEKVANLVENGEVIAPVHLYIGQEAIAAGVCQTLEKEDYVFSNHRGHGHYLAKGGNALELMAEILCRESGCSKGRGGSMHIVAPDFGILGTSSIVGGSIPIGTGAALASKIRGSNRMSVTFLGDGAVDEGVFYESLNFATIYNLPVFFVIENNQYASHLHLKFRQKIKHLSKYGEIFGIKSKTIDGNDALEVYENALQAVDYIRSGNGPFILECMVNRWRGHVGPRWDTNVGLRSQEQIDEWVRNCPIELYQDQLVAAGVIDKDTINEMIERTTSLVEEITQTSMRSPKPPSGEVARFVYAEDE